MANLLYRSLKAAGSGLRTGWLILGIALLLIVVGEGGLRLALTAKGWLTGRPRTEHRSLVARKIDLSARADAYHGAAWTHDYFTELESARTFVWQPYVSWRNPPYRGRYIAVDRNGLRATWNPPTRDLADPPVRIATFGGSTMWGAGARDDHTVASYLSKLLHARGYRAEVTNYGQLAYVGTQEAIALLRCIHRGERPDIALFYDGINDVFSSYKNNVAGVPLHEWWWRTEFELLDRPRRLLGAASRRLLDKQLWGFDGLMARLRRRRGSLPSDNGSRAHLLSDEVVRQTLRVYASNLAAIESLGRRYGFEPLFYWQPYILSKRHRSPDEQTFAEHRSSAVEQQAINTIYRRVRQSEALNSRPRFHNISALFDDLEAPYYVDVAHLSGPGNRLVAAAMVEDVIARIELIERRRAAAVKQRPSRSFQPF